MFRGRYDHIIDSKGRVSFPVKLRDIFFRDYDDKIVLTNFDRCLVAYPLQEWEKLEEKVRNLPLLKEEVKWFQRYFISGAVDITIDKQGRILIPQTLRDFADLKKDVVFVGQINNVEVWNKERWEDVFKESQNNFSRISDTLSALGL